MDPTTYTGFWWAKVRERRTRCRWEDIIKMGLQEIGFWVVDWTNVAPDKDTYRTVVKAVMNNQIS